MFRLKHKNLLSRGKNLLFALVLGATVLEFLLKPSGAVIAWTLLIGLLIVGGIGLAIPLEIEEPEPSNRWYRAAYWGVWLFCALPGAMIIGAAVAWGITGPTLEQFPGVSSVLLLTGMVLGLVGFLVVGGLAVTGEITKGNEETRQ